MPFFLAIKGCFEKARGGPFFSGIQRWRRAFKKTKERIDFGFEGAEIWMEEGFWLKEKEAKKKAVKEGIFLEESKLLPFVL